MVTENATGPESTADQQKSTLVREAYYGSDPAATRKLYRESRKRGAYDELAVLCLKVLKAIGRARQYRGESGRHQYFALQEQRERLKELVEFLGSYGNELSPAPRIESWWPRSSRSGCLAALFPAMRRYSDDSEAATTLQIRLPGGEVIGFWTQEVILGPFGVTYSEEPWAFSPQTEERILRFAEVLLKIEVPQEQS